jgi:para-aminobenzoate synthetase component I
MPQPSITESITDRPTRGGWRRLRRKTSPIELAGQLRHLSGLIFLDSATNVGRSIIAAEPTEILTGHIDRDWQQIEDHLATHSQEQLGTAPGGGLFGWVGYDGNYRFGVYPQVLAYDHAQETWHSWGQLEKRCRPCGRPVRPRLVFHPQVSADAYIQAVQQAQAYIAAGDIYQVNLAYPWRSDWPAEADAWGYYWSLRQASPAPFAAYMDLGDSRLCSASPECFLAISDRRITTRPIKGTRPRYPHDVQQDQAAALELRKSTKEQAELLMITDLERNDLGQICDFGTVQVPALAEIESFAQVFHLVSTVQGQLRPEISHAQAFRACFPGGSITGAPKLRARQIIDELESHPRGVYTGAMGYFGYNRQSQFNIVIRTAIQTGDHIDFHVGAGIVADSQPAAEHTETLQKAAGLLLASGAIETR